MELRSIKLPALRRQTKRLSFLSPLGFCPRVVPSILAPLLSATLRLSLGRAWLYDSPESPDRPTGPSVLSVKSDLPAVNASLPSVPSVLCCSFTNRAPQLPSLQQSLHSVSFFRPAVVLRPEYFRQFRSRLRAMSFMFIFSTCIFTSPSHSPQSRSFRSGCEFCHVTLSVAPASRLCAAVLYVYLFSLHHFIPSKCNCQVPIYS